MRKSLHTILLSLGFSAAGVLNGLAWNDKAYNPEIYDKIANMEIPLVVINTVDGEEPTCDIVVPPEGSNGFAIANATKVPAGMQIILLGDTLYDSGEYVKKESGLTVKIRGNTSANKFKKPYKLKLQKKADLLFRGDKKYKDKDWVLLRTGSSLVTPIGFWAGELIGQRWTPGHKIVNLWMNGCYRGLYILCEQVTVNPDCRIEVDERDGYVVEADGYWWNEDIYFPSTLTIPELKFSYKYPDPEDITDDWHQYVSSDVLANEEKIKDGTFDEAYDMESFARWLVAWDLLGSRDVMGANMYIVKKDTESKIEMGPMWDFDNGFWIKDKWINLHTNYFYFHHMLRSDNDAFRRAFYNVWQERGRSTAEGLIERINGFADSPAGGDYQTSLHYENELEMPTDWWQPYLGDLEFMRKYFTEFLADRADWIDENIEAAAVVDGIGAENVEDGFSYDILGRRVDPDTPGIQIRNGKKVFVKP